MQDTAIGTTEDEYAVYRMVPFPMMLNDPRFKVTPIFDAEYVITVQDRHVGYSG